MTRFSAGSRLLNPPSPLLDQWVAQGYATAPDLRKSRGRSAELHPSIQKLRDGPEGLHPAFSSPPSLE